MPRGLRIGFNQGPNTLYASTGKYGILAPAASLVGSSGPVSQRRYFDGHYTALLKNNSVGGGQKGVGGGFTGDPYLGIYNSGPISKASGTWKPTANVARTASSNPVLTNTACLVVRYMLRELDKGPIGPGGSIVYDFDTRVDREFAQALSWTPAIPIMMLIESRTFDNTNPLPNDISGHAFPFTTGSGLKGYQAARWNSVVRARFAACFAALGVHLGSNPLMAGIATQETSTGGVLGDSYTPDDFLAGLFDESDAIAAADPHFVHMAYLNFLNFRVGDPGPPTHASAKNMLEQYAARVVKNGGIVGTPDLVSMDAGIIANVYSILTDVQNKTSLSGGAFATPMPAKGRTFSSAQNGEYLGKNAGDSPVSIPNLYNYGTGSATYAPADFTPHDNNIKDWSGAVGGQTSPLRLTVMVWDDHTTGAVTFLDNVAPIIAAHKTFGPVLP